MIDWNLLVSEIKAIQKHENEHWNNIKPDTYYSLGDVFMMIENSFIGKCGATKFDYNRAIKEYWQTVKY